MIRSLLTGSAIAIGILLVLFGSSLARMDPPDPAYADFPGYGRVIVAVGLACLALVYVGRRRGR